MAHRDIRSKQANRLRKALRNTLPSHINLYDYLLDRGMVKSRKEAREAMLAGRVRADSHPLGKDSGKRPKRSKLAVALKSDETILEIEDYDFVDPIVPASLRGRIQVLPAS